MSISNKDYEAIKSRIAGKCVRIQFEVGDYLDSKGYTGELGEPIILRDKDVFAVCDGKSIANRRYYPIKSDILPILDDTLEASLEHMIDFFIEKVPVGTLSSKFPVEGSKLSRDKLIEAFTGTNKFCLPDGRSLPQNCYATRVLGITSAPSLAGRFLRHYDASSQRSLGETQGDSLGSHRHSIEYSNVNYQGRLVRSFKEIRRDKSWYWKDGSYVFVFDVEYGDFISSYKFPYSTEYAGDSESRPKNLSYLSFYRYDL
ncbi:hypothetical protein [Borrelia miyamotoi]|uniref:hypothetical protein n=1 Tax=Borrelia miyamotoi TaxID=47466 RepID=UPI001404503C|nr:hypothetical protein [Borrelia miyamotoi]WDS47703.1 hypothetical protein EZU72_008835 [Borrelia miyamotoi]